MKNEFMERNHIGTIDIVFAVIIAICVLLLLGANLARPEISRVIFDQELYVEPDGVYVEYKGEIYVHTSYFPENEIYKHE